MDYINIKIVTTNVIKQADVVSHSTSTNRSIPNQMLKSISIVTFVIFVTACSSLVDKGDKLFEKGMFEDAAAFYERALLRDPNDIEATVGLQRSRNRIIDSGLIDVRMMRLSSNYVGAANKLEDILRKQESWNIKMLGAASITQEEETGYAEKWLRSEAENLSQSQHPDRFLWFKKSYSFLIRNAQFDSHLEQYQRSLNHLGKQKCHSLVSDVSGQKFYLSEFVEKYCHSWGETVSLTLDEKDKSRYQGLVSREFVRFNTEDNSAQKIALRNQLSKLEDQFKNSLWYSSNGEMEVEMDVAGRVDYSRSIKRIVKSKTYSEKVTEQLPDGTNKTKSVERTYRYPVAVYNEKYNMRITYRAMLHSQTLKHELTESERNQDEGHNSTFRPARVYPSTARLMSTNDIIKRELSTTNLQIQNKLNNLWKESYCSNGLGSQQGENILRCGKVEPDNAYVNNWFTQRFGVDYQVMKSIYDM